MVEVPPENCARVEEVIDGDLLVIDVRNPEEVATGKIESKRWLNIPIAEFTEAMNMSQKDFKDKYGEDKPDDGSGIVTNCGSGNRSSRALKMALEMGMNKAKHLPGGYKLWKKTVDERVK